MATVAAQMTQDTEDPLLKPAEVAGLLRKTTMTLYRWRKAGTGPEFFYPPDHKGPLYRLSAVNRWLGQAR